MQIRTIRPFEKAILLAASCLLLPFSAVLAQEAPPAAPSDVRTAVVTQPDGSRAVQVSWQDNSDNELGFVVTDQATGRQYDSLPNPEGKGARMSMTVSVEAGCFQVFAYNNYGASLPTEAICTTLPPDPGLVVFRALLIVLVAGALIFAGFLLALRVYARTRKK